MKTDERHCEHGDWKVDENGRTLEVYKVCRKCGKKERM